MRKLLLLLSLSGVLHIAANAQGYQPNFNRGGLYLGLGMNTLGGAVESTGLTQTMKGGSSLLATVGGFYELAVDKNLSFIGSLGLGYTSFNYSYSKEFSSIGSIQVDSNSYTVYPTGGADPIKSNNSVLMVMPQFEIAFMSNPIKEMYVIDFRLGFGAGLYLTGKTEQSSEDITYQTSTEVLNYNVTQKLGYNDGKKWASNYGLVYIGMRWRNTTNEILNRSAIGLNITFPFGDYRAGGADITYSAMDWNQTFGKEEIKFNLMSFGLKYSYNFMRYRY